MRCTCASSTAGSFSRPEAASSISCWSGPSLQMRKESREASARSSTATTGSTASQRRRLRGKRLGAEQELGARQDGREPAFDAGVEVARLRGPSRRTPSAPAGRSSVTGRRNACSASCDRMRRAHGASSSAVRGMADEDASRLSVSPTPVTLNGPEMSTPGMVGVRSISGSSAIGCSGESDSANERCTKATPTRWARRPCTLTRMWLNRDCISSAAMA